MNDRRKTGEGGMKGWVTRRQNGTDSPKQLRAEIERLQRELNLLRELHHSAEKEVNELRAVLEYIKNLPLGDELDIARRAARRALEGK